MSMSMSSTSFPDSRAASSLSPLPLTLNVAPESAPSAAAAEQSCFSCIPNVTDITPWTIIEGFNYCVDHWREGMMFIGVAIAVIGAAVAFFAGLSVWWSVTLLGLAAVMGFAGYQMGDILTSRELNQKVKELSGVVDGLKIVRAKLRSDVDDLTGQVGEMTTQVVELRSVRVALEKSVTDHADQNKAHVVNNELSQAQIQQLGLRVDTMKQLLESTGATIRENLGKQSEENGHASTNNATMRGLLTQTAEEVRLAQLALTQIDAAAGKGVEQQKTALDTFLRDFKAGGAENLRKYEDTERKAQTAQKAHEEALAAHKKELADLQSKLEATRAAADAILQGIKDERAELVKERAQEAQLRRTHSDELSSSLKTQQALTSEQLLTQRALSAQATLTAVGANAVAGVVMAAAGQASLVPQAPVPASVQPPVPSTAKKV